MRYEYGIRNSKGQVGRYLTKAYALEAAHAEGVACTVYRRLRFNGTMDWNTWMIGAEKVVEFSLFEAEYTDTFGGEANYCWVKRERFLAPCDATNRTVMRKAKAAVGLTCMRGRTDGFGETQRFRPYGSCTVLFVSYVDE